NLVAGTYTLTVTDANLCSATVSATITQPSATLTVTAASVSNVTCFAEDNGSVTVGVSGGTSPYRYSWSNSDTTQNITMLAAGTYSVTVLDAHLCSATSSVTISQPAAGLIVNILNATNVSCYGGNNGS